MEIADGCVLASGLNRKQFHIGYIVCIHHGLSQCAILYISNSEMISNPSVRREERGRVRGATASFSGYPDFHRYGLSRASLAASRGASIGWERVVVG